MELNARAAGDCHTCCWHSLVCTGWRRRKLPLHLVSAPNLPDARLLSLLGSALKLRLRFCSDHLDCTSGSGPIGAPELSGRVLLCGHISTRTRLLGTCSPSSRCDVLMLSVQGNLGAQPGKKVRDFFDQISHLENGEAGTPEHAAASCQYWWCL